LEDALYVPEVRLAHTPEAMKKYMFISNRENKHLMPEISTISAKTSLSARSILFFLPFLTVLYGYFIPGTAFAQTELDLGNFTVRNTTISFASSNTSISNSTANISEQPQQPQQPQQSQSSLLDQEEQLTQGTQQEQQQQEEQ
jgi:hypothetical protein